MRVLIIIITILIGIVIGIVLGMMISIKLTFAVAKNKEKRIQKNRIYINLMCDWMEKNLLGIRISDRINGIKANKVAIYGYGRIGKLLCKQLLNDGVEVTCILDKMKKENDSNNTKEIDIYSLKDDYPNSDIIIVTPFLEFESIVEDIRKKDISSKIISVQELLS